MSRDRTPGRDDAGHDDPASGDSARVEPPDVDPAGEPEPGADEGWDDGAPAYCTYTDYVSGVDVADLPATGDDATGPEAAVFERLYDVEDPEMPISVVDLGLIYGVTVEDGHATVTMTLTYTGCPARDYLQEDVRLAAERAEGVDSAAVELVWSPEWSLEMVTETGREDLRSFGVAI